PDFIAQADFDQPLIVACYHGISSQGAAAYLAHQGFSQVYSLNGGFEGWRAAFPEEIQQETVCSPRPTTRAGPPLTAPITNYPCSKIIEKRKSRTTGSRRKRP